jgi:hypothetical protein
MKGGGWGAGDHGGAARVPDGAIPLRGRDEMEVSA